MTKMRKASGVKNQNVKNLVEIDIKGGKLTFGQRLKLGEIFASELSDVEKLEQTFICLHNFKPGILDYKKLLDYFTRIVEGIVFWSEQEATLLKYEPTADELRAGINELAKKIGEFGTIKSLAKAYHVDPDVVLDWDYGKVFGILFTDLEEFKFQTRFNKVIEAKYKT